MLNFICNITLNLASAGIEPTIATIVTNVPSVLIGGGVGGAVGIAAGSISSIKGHPEYGMISGAISGGIAGTVAGSFTSPIPVVGSLVSGCSGAICGGLSGHFASNQTEKMIEKKKPKLIYS